MPYFNGGTPRKIYLNTYQTAQRLGLSQRTLEKWRALGIGPIYVKIGARVLYDQDVIDDWVSGNSRRSTHDPL